MDSRRAPACSQGQRPRVRVPRRERRRDPRHPRRRAGRGCRSARERRVLRGHAQTRATSGEARLGPAPPGTRRAPEWAAQTERWRSGDDVHVPAARPARHRASPEPLPWLLHFVAPRGQDGDQQAAAKSTQAATRSAVESPFTKAFWARSTRTCRAGRRGARSPSAAAIESCAASAAGAGSARCGRAIRRGTRC